MPAGFPTLEVPESSLLSTATTDPLGDTRTQNIIKLTEKAMTRPEGGWDLIHGKLMVFTDPQRGLLPIDRLEGFRPGRHSMYQRVLVAVELNGLIWPVWLYNYKLGHNADRIVLPLASSEIKRNRLKLAENICLRASFQCFRKVI